MTKILDTGPPIPRDGASERYLHPAVERELASPSTEGDRHNQILRVLPYLVGDGWRRQELFELFRSRYPSEFPDVEIRQLVDWGLSRDFQPSRANRQHNGLVQRCKLPYEPHKLVPLTPEQRKKREEQKARACQLELLKWLNGFRVHEYDLWEKSPVRPTDEISQDAELLFRHLFGRGELSNVCTKYTPRGGKAQPCGAGMTMAALDWCRYLQSEPVPQSQAGAWVRINPLKAKLGSGRSGSFTDSDVEEFRYHLLESDALPLELLLALLVRLRLPIAMILDTGGRSYHAWVKSYARTLNGYRAESDYLTGKLDRFGIDRGNKNPSRFSRLPGAMRTIGARKTEPPGLSQVAQRILYLNPQPKKGVSIF
jgi:hypothetical protein